MSRCLYWIMEFHWSCYRITSEFTVQRKKRNLMGSALFQLLESLKPIFLHGNYNIEMRLQELLVKYSNPELILRKIYKDISGKQFIPGVDGDFLVFERANGKRTPATFQINVTKNRPGIRELFTVQVFGVPFEFTWQLQKFLENLEVYSQLTREVEVEFYAINMAFIVENVELSELLFQLMEQGAPATKIESGNSVVIPTKVHEPGRIITRKTRLQFKQRKKSAFMEFSLPKEYLISDFPAPDGGGVNSEWMADLSSLFRSPFVKVLSNIEEYCIENDYFVNFDFARAKEAKFIAKERYPKKN